MNLYGQEFRPYRQRWEIDRVGVHRIVMACKYAGEPPMDTVPTPPRDILHVLTKDNPEDDASHGIVQYFFEGATLADIGVAIPQYEFNGSYNQEPITSHPKIVELLKKYKGRLKDGRVEWPSTLGGATTTGGIGGRPSKSDTNPMYGAESYLDFGATWSEVRIFAELPGDLWHGVGEIYENPPGNPPDPGKRNWLKLAPVGRQRGNITEVTFPFLLSGRNGWVAPIYSGSIV